MNKIICVVNDVGLKVLNMRIVHFEEAFHPSFGYQVNVLSKFQAKAGNEVIIITSISIENYPGFKGVVSDKDLYEYDDEFYKNYNVRIIRLPIYGVYSGRVFYKGNVKKIIKELNPDILMCHGIENPFAMSVLLNNDFTFPIVFDSHMLEMASKNRFKNVFRYVYKKIFASIINNKKYIVIRTQDDNYINIFYGINKELTPYISFGTDTSLFKKDERIRKKIRSEYNINNNDFVFIYTGKLDSAKGGLLLVNAFSDKFKTSRNIVLFVIGNSDGEYGKKVERLFEISNNRIIRLPLQKYIDLNKYYMASDVMVFPKQCSLSFFDAQACGLPVVFEDNNVNIKRAQFHNAITFKSDDVSDFRKKIEYFINMNYSDFIQYSNNSQKYIVNNYDYNDIEKKYFKVYKQIIDNYYLTEEKKND